MLAPASSLLANLHGTTRSLLQMFTTLEDRDGVTLFDEPYLAVQGSQEFAELDPDTMSPSDPLHLNGTNPFSTPGGVALYVQL
jgi:hypothetical protein